VRCLHVFSHLTIPIFLLSCLQINAHRIPMAVSKTRRIFSGSTMQKTPSPSLLLPNLWVEVVATRPQTGSQMLSLVNNLTLTRRTSTPSPKYLSASALFMLRTFPVVPVPRLSLRVIHLRHSWWRSLQMTMKMGVSNRTRALNQTAIPVTNPRPT
jgi:hypothetical protein